MAWDAAGHRAVLVGGLTPLSVDLNDTWIFENGDWRQIEDAPTDPTTSFSTRDLIRFQVVFDRARGVVTGLFEGHLFDLQGDSWVERAIDVVPRPDALLIYDEFNEELLFVGGLDFEIVITTATRANIGASVAAEVARFDLRATGAAIDAVLTDLRIDATAGASGADDTGGVDGVSLLMWGASSFVPLADNAAPASAPGPLTVTRTAATIGTALASELVLALVSAPTGPSVDDARVVATRLETVLRYHEP